MEKYQKEQLMAIYGHKLPVANLCEVNEKFDA